MNMNVALLGKDGLQAGRLIVSRSVDIASSPRLAAVLAGVFAILLGDLVLLGWVLDITTFKSVLPGLVPMKVNTAVCFILSGTALCLLTTEQADSRARMFARACAFIIISTGGLTLAQDILHLDFGIDQLLATEILPAGSTASPGRMVPITAISFILIGLALLLASAASYRIRDFADWPALLAGLTGLQTIAGYLYGVETLSKAIYPSAMALNTALAFIVLTAGILFLQPNRGLSAMIAGESPGSHVARRLLPAAILLPILLGWLSLQGQKMELYGMEFGVVILAAGSLVIFTILILGTSLSLNRVDAERSRAKSEIHALNATLEQRVRERTAQLDAANKELESFAHSISHDLRAPLRSIDSFAKALLDDYGAKLDEEGKDHLHRVRDASQNIRDLIDDILKLSRVTRGDIDIGPVDLTTIAESTAAGLRKSSPDRNVNVSIAPGVTGRGDARLLGVVLENLLSNAWKFTGKQDAARIEFGAERKNGELVCHVRDNGAGFDMAYVNNLFAPFQRLHLPAEFPGNGIGLATTKRIIARHGGRVWAVGAVDGGAVFYFTLPDTSIEKG